MKKGVERNLNITDSINYAFLYWFIVYGLLLLVSLPILAATLTVAYLGVSFPILVVSAVSSSTVFPTVEATLLLD